MTIPKELKTIEQFLAFRTCIYQVLGHFFLFTVLVFLVWGVEYLVTEKDFANWIADRIVFVGLLGFVTIVVYFFQRRRIDKATQQLIGISDRLPENSQLHGTHYQCGGVIFETEILGPFTIGVNSNGISICRGGNLMAYFNWESISHLKNVSRSSDHLQYEVALVGPSTDQSRVFSIPMNEEMLRSVKAEVVNRS